MATRPDRVRLVVLGAAESFSGCTGSAPSRLSVVAN